MSDVIESARRHVQAATLASLEGDLERALSELIIASEEFVDGMQYVKNKEERKNLIIQFDECAEEAERIKARQKLPTTQHRSSKPGVLEKHNHDSAHSVLSRRGPVPCMQVRTKELRSPTKKEQMILLTSSKIDDRVFPVWNDASIASHLAINEPYADPAPLFGTDKDFVRGYERLSKVSDELTMSDTDMVLHTSLAQSVVNDCSLVVSLIVASQWTSRFRTRLLTSLLYPQNEQTEPVLSTQGKYMMRVELNGTTRQVVVDDYVPLSGAGDFRAILVFATNYPNVVWPAIVEKIFLKVSGPDFRGSNSASDLKLLIGWLPEEITFRHSTLDADMLWSRIHQPWMRGDVLITLGSGKLSVEEEEEYGIVTEHSYAVTGIHENTDGKFLTIQNPWNGESGAKHTKTIFDMDLTQVFYRFATIFLNWNPQLWPYKASVHAQTNESQFSITTHNVSHCPQYLLSNDSNTSIPIFLLLTRHKTSSISRKVYASLAIYDNAGERVLTDTLAIAKGHYHASYEFSLPISLPPGTQYTIVLSQRAPLPRESITLVACSKSASIRLEPLPESSLHRHVEEGEWTVESAGGPSPVPTFSRNPWFKITTTGDTKLTVVLESESAHSVGFAMTHSHARPLILTSRNMAGGSATHLGVTYAPSVVSATVSLRAGTFAMTCTTARPDQLGRFTLSLWSDRAVSVEAGRAIGAGRLRQVRKWYWSKTLTRQRFQLASERMNPVTIHLHGPRTATVLLELTDCRSAGADSRAEVVARSEGQGSVGVESVVLLRNHTYSLACQVSECHADVEFEVQVYSASVLELSRS
ncbi:Calpain-like protease PalBory [Taphrina deformans PYCC 5710]|uniref:Calpain-like protease PalBory n=1 Tax=Taphrina deformans (strain PYCC 5710 / ATCC 11124 / CBS 356.35 / IMI 108563 / JCM 9778 / NBRC 8474) TaxID=1097556 RepID=R4X6S2_TAPDE|nr:Calpain-like protease PalBory [Taphrina deformans PYCC 5710]|eukprot:CCG80901.1 Calpain-like protease PalBory [Taphrina deformans PYCC 5710]